MPVVGSSRTSVGRAVALALCPFSLARCRIAGVDVGLRQPDSDRTPEASWWKTSVRGTVISLNPVDQT